MVGKEPVDILLLDRKQKTCLLAEIKASPLAIFPLAAPSEQLTEESGWNITKLSDNFTMTLTE